jgi:probable rRNA maturation factor
LTLPSSRSTDIISVDVAVDGWRTGLTGDASAQAITAAKAALASAGPSYPVEISVCLTGDREIRSLNNAYRGRDAATNVLSFALSEDDASPAFEAPLMDDAPRLLGDVVVAYETCANEAGDQSKPLADHLHHMVVHGVLHLLGYDHEIDDDAVVMEDLERNILADLGVPDPYARAAA